MIWRNLIEQLWRAGLKSRMPHIRYFAEHPHEVQAQLLSGLLHKAASTEWGKRFDFASIKKSGTFAERLPIVEYEDIKLDIQRMMHGEKDVLWPGQVKWYSKSSGTTNDKSKFIPVTPENLRSCHIKGPWDAATLLYHNRPDMDIYKGKSLILAGSHKTLEGYPETHYGDVSAIMLQHMPIVGRPFYAPDFKTALTENTEEKLLIVARKLIHEDIRVIGGVPTWLVVLFRFMMDITGKKNMLEIWPNLRAYMHGGVSFEPYREQFHRLIPNDNFAYMEAYNASEGFFAVQSDLREPGLLLLLQNGIYYEFLPIEEWEKENPIAVPLSQVETGRHYAPIISTNAGLWRYMPGDVVEFTSLAPYKIHITGRTRQFVNAFGEEVMVSNTDKALAMTCREMDVIVSEYTVAPVYFKQNGTGGHEWIVEFDKAPEDIEAFNNLLDTTLQKINSDYEAKRFKGLAMQRLKLRIVPRGTFLRWLKSKGKFGGQHKVPRLSNDRRYVEEILRLVGGG